MLNDPSQASPPTSGLASQIPRWQTKLFDNDTIAALRHVHSATNSDVNIIYRAITVNRDRIASLAQKHEDLTLESKRENRVKDALTLEVKRLEKSLAIHRREIRNIDIREDMRQDELRKLKDIELVMLVQALREKTPEGWRTERATEKRGAGEAND